MEGYVTETERVRKRLKETLTLKEKAANWWDYHKFHVLIAAAAVLVVCWFIAEGLRTVPADYTVGYVSGTEIDGETADAITDALARYGQDVNGDGVVHVELHRMIIDLGLVLERGGATDGQKELGNLMALEADLNMLQSGIFLTDDPAALQAYTGALLYRDGGQPAADAQDWENMALAWDDCPGLGESPTGKTLYLVGRGCWNEDQRGQWSQNWEFWQAIQRGQ